MTTTSSDTTTGTYAIDAAHSRIGFSARHAMVTKVRGSFTEFSGSGFFDVDNPASSYLSLSITAASIATGNADRDTHLRSNDFFDMAQFPVIDFTSTSVERLEDGRYAVTGDLTIKGVTKPVTVEFEYTGAATDPFGNQRIGFEGTATVNRKDWGVNFNAVLETGGVMISEKITLEFDVSAIRSVDAA